MSLCTGAWSLPHSTLKACLSFHSPTYERKRRPGCPNEFCCSIWSLLCLVCLHIPLCYTYMWIYVNTCTYIAICTLSSYSGYSVMNSEMNSERMCFPYEKRALDRQSNKLWGKQWWKVKQAWDWRVREGRAETDIWSLVEWTHVSYSHNLSVKLQKPWRILYIYHFSFLYSFWKIWYVNCAWWSWWSASS